MSRLPTKLEMLRKGAQVSRFHTWTSILPYRSVGHHSHGVACLAHYIDPQCSRNVLLAAVHHDLVEYETGDIPSPAKWRYQKLKEAAHEASSDLEEQYGFRHDLTLAEQELLRWVDMADLVLYALDEWYAGNHAYELVVRRGLSKLETWTPPNATAARLLADMLRTEGNFSRNDYTMAIYRSEL